MSKHHHWSPEHKKLEQDIREREWLLRKINKTMEEGAKDSTSKVALKIQAFYATVQAGIKAQKEELRTLIKSERERRKHSG